MELDGLDSVILANIAKDPGKPIANAFFNLTLPLTTLYYRVRIMAEDGLIDLDSKAQKGRKLASLTDRGREALA